MIVFEPFESLQQLYGKEHILEMEMSRPLFARAGRNNLNTACPQKNHFPPSFCCRQFDAREVTHILRTLYATRRRKTIHLSFFTVISCFFALLCGSRAGVGRAIHFRQLDCFSGHLSKSSAHKIEGTPYVRSMDRLFP